MKIHFTTIVIQRNLAHRAADFLNFRDMSFLGYSTNGTHLGLALRLNFSADRFGEFRR